MLEIRHPPLDVSGPLEADGRLTLTDPDTRVDIDARLNWGLDLAADARTESIERTDAVMLAAGPTRLSLHAARDGRIELRLESDRLALTRPDNVSMNLRPLTLNLASDGRDPGRLVLDLQAALQPASTTSRAILRVDHIDPERAAAWFEALATLRASPPGSASASLAWVGVASTWEQLARADLTLELDPLELDGQATLSGRWQPAVAEMQWTGAGPVDTVERWVVPILALLSGEPATELREEFALQVEAVADQPGLTIVDNRFRLDWPAAGVP